mmetsp:Transcript_35699/g.85230  ORF Transcript_35699/g.85230 Transcript_35699/m.85230 type:complete len:356 (-) Transcript_35699:254-1321(-)
MVPSLTPGPITVASCGGTAASLDSLASFARLRTGMPTSKPPGSGGPKYAGTSAKAASLAAASSASIMGCTIGIQADSVSVNSVASMAPLPSASKARSTASSSICGRLMPSLRRPCSISVRESSPSPLRSSWSKSSRCESLDRTRSLTMAIMAACTVLFWFSFACTEFALSFSARFGTEEDRFLLRSNGSFDSLLPATIATEFLRCSGFTLGREVVVSSMFPLLSARGAPVLPPAVPVEGREGFSTPLKSSIRGLGAIRLSCPSSSSAARLPRLPRLSVPRDGVGGWSSMMELAEPRRICTNSPCAMEFRRGFSSSTIELRRTFSQSPLAALVPCGAATRGGLPLQSTFLQQGLQP